jgi:hypothetical protein
VYSLYSGTIDSALFRYAHIWVISFKEKLIMKQKSENNSLFLFFLIAYAFSWLFWIPEALASHGMALPTAVTGFLSSPFNPAAFGPLVSALLLTLVNDGWKGVLALLKRGVDFRFKKIWLFPIFLLPLVIFAGSILVSVLFGATPLDISVLTNPMVAIVGFIVILLTAGPLQEEFGWRGFALPRLQTRFNALNSSLILGILWWLWHLPLVFIQGKFMVDSPMLFGALMFEIVLTTILFTWIYNNTNGSLLATLLFHTAMNWSIWVVLPGMKVTAAIIGITVVILLAVLAIIALISGRDRLINTKVDE